MMANVVLQCTVCGQQNTVPRLHSNMLQKDGASTFCSSCNGVTQQKVAGGTPPAQPPGRDNSPNPTAPGGNPAPKKLPMKQPGGLVPPGGGGGGAPGQLPAKTPPRVTPQTSGLGGGQSSPSSAQVQPTLSGAGMGQPQNNGNLSDDQLWQAMQNKLNENHLSLDDVYRCDEPTQTRLLTSLGFNAQDQQRLVAQINQKNPFKRGATPQQNNNLAANNQLGGLNTPQTLGLPPQSPVGGTFTGGQSNPASGRFEGASPIRGLEISGENIIARCSVYPNMPAEYWCAACNVLVSSRCHVQGIHKDHPFISLRLAAEAHIRDLSAWSERVRNQLNVTSSVVSNLKHAETTLQSEAQRQYDALDEHCNQIYQDLLRWKEQLKQDISAQLVSQQTALRHACDQSEQLHALYSHQLSKCEPLINNVPPPEQRDPMEPPPAEVRQDGWALRVLDLVSKLKIINSEPIPMPRVSVPQVVCHSTPSTHMELLKCTYTALGVRLPDMVDPSFFNFPHAGGQRRLPFTLEGGDDALAKGILIHNGRTLTRTQDVVPAHVLCSASQVFFSGVTTWDVHVDRLGTGPGRILLGIILHGTDGEGVVWDGHRIVGPNEGECRMIDERYVIQPGTVLRLHLELEPPSCFLHCFINRDGVAKIPLPATGQGWTPAFSVFGPQDQITVTPTSATQQQVPGSTAQIDANRMASPNAGGKPGAPTAVAAGGVPTSPNDRDKNGHLINSLQQQIQVLSERLNNQQNQQMMTAANSRLDAVQSPQPVLAAASPGFGVQPAQPVAAAGPGAGNFTAPSPPQQNPNRRGSLPPVAPTVTGGGGLGGVQRQAAPEAGRGGAVGLPKPAGGGVEAYSPELKSLMRYVSDIN